MTVLHDTHSQRRSTSTFFNPAIRINYRTTKARFISLSMFGLFCYKNKTHQTGPISRGAGGCNKNHSPREEPQPREDTSRWTLKNFRTVINRKRVLRAGVHKVVTRAVQVVWEGTKKERTLVGARRLMVCPRPASSRAELEWDIRRAATTSRRCGGPTTTRVSWV